MAAEPEAQTQSLDKEVNDTTSSESRKADDASEKHDDGPNEPDEEKAIEQPKPAGPGPPPNGGAVAWIQVLGGWMLFFNTWGILNTFGVYQTYYESGAQWTASSSDISWIGSIQALMVLVTGSFSGPIFDRGYLRTLLLVGSFGIVFGHMMLSLCSAYWQCLLAQGFVIGIGAGCLFIPAVAILPTYFTTRIGLAIGLAASGSSMGGIIYPIMFYKLVDKVGFGWSTRILGFTALATLLIPIFVMKMRVQPPKARSIIDWTAFTDWPFMFFIFGAIVGFIGLYVGLFYTSYYGQATGVTDDSLSFYLVPILNAGSVLGRTLPNWVSDKVGPLNVIAPGAMCVGIVLLCYMAVSSAGGMIAVTLLFGFFSGIFIALPPVLIVALTKDKSKIGTRIGMGFTMLGIGVLAGGPGGGSILGDNQKDLHWNGVWIYGGVCVLAASATFFTLRVIKAGFNPMVKI